MLLFLATNMTVVTSRANQQFFSTGKLKLLNFLMDPMLIYRQKLHYTLQPASQM